MQQIVRRDVHCAHDPVLADVEDVDACGRLLEVAEEQPAAGEGIREDRAVDTAVQDGMVSLRFDGARKVMQGMTTVEEVMLNTVQGED